jgi:6-phosphogluconolactonase (cycloisomerase 2 family)
MLAALVVAVVSPGEATAGVLTQPASPAGCVSDDGSGGACADGVALANPHGVAVSADGKHVYAAANGANAVAAFARDRATGALTQLAGTTACVSDDGTGGACAMGHGLEGAVNVAVSPDGKHVYVASLADDAIAVFARNKSTGALTQLAGMAGCVSESGLAGACDVGVGLGGATGVAVSADGKHVYVASQTDNAVAAFARNRATGALTQLAGQAACVSEDGTGGACGDGVALNGPSAVVVSADGKHVYVTSKVSGAVAAFARNKTTGALTQLAGTAACVSDDGTGGACTDGVALGAATSLALAPSGKHLYVAAAGGGVAAFARNKTTGALAQLAGPAACVSEDGTGGACADGVALSGAYSVVVSGDGAHVYVGSLAGAGVAAFARNTATGVLTQLAGTAACVTEDGTGGACADGVALESPTGLAMSKDGKHVYGAVYDASAVAIFARER